MSVNIYIDSFSPPARSVHAYSIAAKIPYKVQRITIAKGENKTEAFKKINPFGKVPALEDNGYVLSEAAAIMVYLANKYANDDTLYPKDPQKRGLVDAYLHWHHQNIRRCSALFAASYPQFFPNYPSTVEAESKAVAKALKDLEQVFLKNKKFLADKENMTIADIFAAAELNQLQLTDFDLSPHKIVQEWLGRCMSHPALKESHETFLKIVSKIKPTAKL